MRGKRGPRPETPAEIAERENDPTAEEIVGKENVVEVGLDAPPPRQQGYVCANCPFRSNLLSEMEEHVNGTGHGKFDTEEVKPADPVQTPLFSPPPGVVHKDIRVPLGDELLNDKRMKLAELYQKALDVKDEKKAADEDCNTRLKMIDQQMQEIARVLKMPFTWEKVNCEWRIIGEENARGLFRLDTGEQVDVQPLAEEDRVRELEEAAEDNADAEVAVEG